MQARSPPHPQGPPSRTLGSRHVFHQQAYTRLLVPLSQSSRDRQKAVCTAAAHFLSPASLAVSRAFPFWLPAILSLWPLSQAAGSLRKWFRAFTKCKTLPATPESLAVLRSLGGDLQRGLSPQIHREFTALAEKLGGVYYSRVLWAQARGQLHLQNVSMINFQMNQNSTPVSCCTGSGRVRSLCDSPSPLQ